MRMNQQEHHQDFLILLGPQDLLVLPGGEAVAEVEVGAERDLVLDHGTEPWEEEEKEAEVEAEVIVEVEVQAQRWNKQNQQKFLEYLD